MQRYRAFDEVFDFRWNSFFELEKFNIVFHSIISPEVKRFNFVIVRESVSVKLQNNSVPLSSRHLKKASASC